MTTEQQAFVLFLSDELLKGMWVPNMQQNEAALRARAAHELRRLHAQTQALIVENETLHAENETLRAGYDAARLEIESLQKAATDRHALQATGAHPAPCARYCEAVAFNIERRNLHAENERLRTCNKDAQHEIANLQERVQELGQMARDVNSRRVMELEAQLEAIGAGGVEPLRKRECLHQISEPAQPVARIRYERNTPGRENEMPRVLSCNRMADGVYEVFTESQVQAMLQPARKPLADGELHALYADVMTGHYTNALHYWRGTPAHRFARAIEAAQGITAAQKGGQHGTE